LVGGNGHRRFTEDELLVQGIVIVFWCNPAQVMHFAQDNAHAPQGIAAACLSQRIVDGRQIGNTGQECAFDQGQVFRVFVKIGLGSRLDTDVAIAHRDQVEIKLHDFVFAALLLQLDGVIPLLDLALG